MGKMHCPFLPLAGMFAKAGIDVAIRGHQSGAFDVQVKCPLYADLERDVVTQS
jgi:hypothetical protein